VKRRSRKKPPYVIEYSPPSREHLGALDVGERARVLDEVDVQLVHQPTLVTRNRKPLQPNPLARFELRIGKLRVYYEVDAKRRVVEIRAVGIKDRDRVFIGGEEIKLS
jgi:mRNA-degrading endonuclease RelE of RelBE toxin-antitoxin system